MEELAEFQQKLRSRSFQLSLKIIYLHKSITINYQELSLSRKLIENGTAVGEHIVEACIATSKLDFNYFLVKAFQALGKTSYWLELLHESGYIDNEDFKALNEEIQSLHRVIEDTSRKLKN